MREHDEGGKEGGRDKVQQEVYIACVMHQPDV